jgi:hypothetical protein
MTRKIRSVERWAALPVVVIVCLLLSTGCQGWLGRGGTAPPEAPPPSAEEEGLPGSGREGAADVPKFYYFEDVPTPSEMDLVKDESLVFQSGDNKTGILILSGRVEPTSLYDFFKAALENEGWNLEAGFHSVRSVMIFKKPDKYCVVNVYEGTLSTRVEIYMASRLAGGL